ncbi:hypothetical protein PACTADRAFT_50599 [Pachysolen tannophilus NRRL Y-2460]|uniref:Magnesium transporter n=1 Tax=Pachysolen tannophilus NRRL Y-2460 TaxID=669874 RepID=A0A1E4TSJ5_PACTA|nr:hypothetical protein PACTADRAFT_50599 [Pachysolen tannophilus NRRL Y-2460]
MFTINQPVLSRITGFRSIITEANNKKYDILKFSSSFLNLRYRSTVSTIDSKVKENIENKNNNTFVIDTDSADSLDEAQTGLFKILKPITPNDAYVSCTIFDINGNVVAVSKKFPKMQFLSENGLYPRDLRKIDSSTIDIIPTIAVRKNCILVNLLHIKAIVKSNTVMIFDTSTPSSATKLSLFMYDLESKLKITPAGSNNKLLANPSQQYYYEFKAIESILINVMTCLETELQLHLNVCGTILEELEDQIDRDKLRELLIKSKALTTFYQKALLIRNVLDELLENDEDLGGMYLTENMKREKQSVQNLSSASSTETTGKDDPENPTDRTDFAEIEMLLEAYYKQCDEFVQQAETLINDIKSTEEIVNIILDANRNSLMLFEIKVTIYTLGFTVATALPAFYGMNLKNYVENSNFGFGAVIFCSIIMALCVTFLNFSKLRSVQRITMMLSNSADTKVASNASKAAAAAEATRKDVEAAMNIQKLNLHNYSGLNHSVNGSSNNSLVHEERKKLNVAISRFRKFIRRNKNDTVDPKQRDMIWKWLVDEQKNQK